MTKAIHIQSIFQMILKLLEQKDMEIDEAFTEGVEFDAQNHEDKRFALAERDRVLIDKGYTKGLREGIGFGYDKGYDIGKNAHQTNRTASYDAGWEEGCEEGHDAGCKEGYEEGHDAGWAEGYEEGHDDGEDRGYSNACLALSTFALSKAEENDDQGYESGVEHAEEVYSKGYADGLADAYKSAEDIDFEVFDDGIKQGFDNACIAMSKYANKLIEDTSDEEEDD